jgi:Asp/Glu/hydantoin racemase
MRLGVLMLDTRFTRFVGDIGNPQSHDGPVLFEVVRGATVDRVVPAKAPPLIEDFIAAGERLIGRGADAITTGCGFLVLNQAELAARLAVPVATSALLLIPTLMKLLPAGRRLGVLTFSARDLTPAHFAAAGAPVDTPVEGVAQDGVFQSAIYEQPCADSASAREAEVVAAARRLTARHTDVGAILFECTNFPPHRAAVEAATGLPVYDVFTLIGLLRSARATPSAPTP